MIDNGLTFGKLPVPGSLVRTAYRVKKGKRIIGYVFSHTGFSYRGSQGWNRGIRLHDFHPIEWGYCRVQSDIGQGSYCYDHRQTAANRLLDKE